MHRKRTVHVLTSQVFDSQIAPAASTNATAMVPVIWGCKAIGQAIGKSGDYVRDTLAKLPDTPVRRQGREYYARADELDAFFR